MYIQYIYIYIHICNIYIYIYIYIYIDLNCADELSKSETAAVRRLILYTYIMLYRCVRHFKKIIIKGCKH